MEAVATLPRQRGNTGPFVWAATVLGVLFATVYVLPTDLTGSNVWGATVVPLLLIAMSIPFIIREAAREGDKRLVTFLVVALIVKLAGAAARRWVAADLYGDRADLTSYHAAGTELSQGFHAGVFDLGGRHFSDTDFIEIVTGFVYWIIGPSLIAGFFFFSWLGYWGLFLMYRAFKIAFPEGRVKSYARLLFFLPSLVFWPSSIGKEAWMMFTLGLTAFGAAKILNGNLIKGAPLAALGLFSGAIVRPHIAVFAGLGLAIGGVIRKPRQGSGKFVPFAKLATLAVLLAGAALLLLRADAFLKDSNIDAQAGLGSALETVADRTSGGHSQFEAPVLTSPSHAPNAVMTVLFRPYLFEARNAQTAAAALEGTCLLLLTVVRFRSWWAAIKGIRRMPYAAFALIYTVLSIAALSTFSNFGILTRQRVLLWPIFIVLLCLPVPPKRKIVR